MYGLDLSAPVIVGLLVVSAILIVVDVVLRKKGLAEDISAERKGAYGVRLAVLAIVTVALLVAVLVT